jgi:hypothetical protein
MLTLNNHKCIVLTGSEVSFLIRELECAFGVLDTEYSHNMFSEKNLKSRYPVLLSLYKEVLK